MEPGNDTIFALATALPPRDGCGIAIVRLSGPQAFSMASRLASPLPDENRVFSLTTLSYKTEMIDQAGIITFIAPHSYTGEDVVEFHIHGGHSIIRSLERALQSLGARIAEPGEFTRRAFLNGRLDLLQAEAVAALVSAVGDAARREALRQRSGVLSDKLKSIRAHLRDLLAKLEVVFDYPEEGVDPTPRGEAIRAIESIRSEVKPLLDSFAAGQLLKGIRLAIIGRPNVGKSSLLNALLNEERAIVTPHPGTTRDVVSASLTIEGVPVEILDTAGIHVLKIAADTAEAEGIRRSWLEVERAHLVLLVIDLSVPLSSEDSELVRLARQRTSKTKTPILLVCNKIDLPSACPPVVVGPFLNAVDLPFVAISALRGDGLDELRAGIAEMLDLDVGPEEVLVTEARHRALLEETDNILKETSDGLSAGIPQDIAATQLWAADRALAGLLGEDLTGIDLDGIFSRFCIGK
jgi:tRNA modification GTPase